MNLMVPKTDRARAKTVNDPFQDMDARQDEKTTAACGSTQKMGAAKCPCTGRRGGA